MLTTSADTWKFYLLQNVFATALINEQNILNFFEIEFFSQNPTIEEEKEENMSVCVNHFAS